MLTNYLSWFVRYLPNSTVIPPFSKVNHAHIKAESGMNPNLVYLNNLFWTPRFYQASTLSTEFKNEMQKFTKLQKWQDKDVLAMTQLILIEATRDTTFDVSFGFQAQPSPLCQYNGQIDCLLYQRYGGDITHGVDDLNEEIEKTQNDERGIGFPLIPIFFPVQQKSEWTPFVQESFPMAQAVSCGLWCLEHMQQVDPSIQYARVIQTDGHQWKLYEVHHTHVKKTKFFKPKSSLRKNSHQQVQFTNQARFFDDYEHMLSVIGMIRFAMGIQENIVMKSEVYEVEELPKEMDPHRTIQRSLLSAKDQNELKTLPDRRIIQDIPVITPLQDKKQKKLNE